MNDKIDLNFFRGCLLGGAVGDALGFAVEFDSYPAILHHYGPEGIREYSLCNGKALISDDTQMTLFTAEGLVSAAEKNVSDVAGIAKCVYISYLNWLCTQLGVSGAGSGQLIKIPELQARRAPGSTCISALSGGRCGSVARPLNGSKGCGGVMRVAPVALAFAGCEDLKAVDLLGAEAAAITHGHELGYIPAAALVHMIGRILAGESIEGAVRQSVESMRELFPHSLHMNEFEAVMDRAVDLAAENEDDCEAVEFIGGGWVGEQALAIAVYCALKYKNDFEKAMIAAVNHGGDSDSTGAITGNILGAYLGAEKIPQKFLRDLELADLIGEMAGKLYCCRRTDIKL